MSDCPSLDTVVPCNKRPAHCARSPHESESYTPQNERDAQGRDNRTETNLTTKVSKRGVAKTKCDSVPLTNRLFVCTCVSIEAMVDCVTGSITQLDTAKLKSAIRVCTI